MEKNMPSPMNISSADDLGRRAAAHLEKGRIAEACEAVTPILSRRISFRLLDRIGTRIGEGSIPKTNPFMTRLADGKAMGAWPLIGSALAAQLDRDLEGALGRCRTFIIRAGVWYAADTLAERVPGAALVEALDRTIVVLKHWRTDPDRWVRKSCGVAVHLWTKRAHGDARQLPKVRKLLAFLAPMFEEQDLDAVKGVGWALKTVSRYYPETLAPWLVRRVGRAKSVRSLMLRKATTFLSSADRTHVYLAMDK
jgi:hypothetical protein